MGPYNASEFLKMANDMFLPNIYCDNGVYTTEKINYAEGNWFDKTSCEALMNHIHIDMCFDYESIEELRETGVKVAQIWVSRLKEEFPDKHFMVFLTVDEGDGEETYISSTLRFCLKREDEPSWSNDTPDGKTFFVWET